jgi:adenosylhomocysteine nucleosidase
MKKCDIVILTALDLEYRAVRERLTGLQRYQHPYGTLFEIGQAGGGCQVALGQIDKGNNNSAVLSERAIAEFSPRALLLVGVAGALQSHVKLGDVVVATRVCAYHGATSDDDGEKSRPQAWEAAHRVIQIAHHLKQVNQWDPDGTGGDATVHFGPIATGDVLLNSKTSGPAQWIRQNYNDCVAIEMESGGVAKAAQLSDALAIGIVRGISDPADGTKNAKNDGQWQPRAAARAATFALALAADLARSSPNRPEGRRGESTSGRTVMKSSNVAKRGAQVGVQMGQVLGNVWISSQSRAPMSLTDELADFRVNLKRAHQAGEIDSETLESVEDELAVLDEPMVSGDTAGKGRVVLSLKRVRGLVGDVGELMQQVVTLIALVKGSS